MSPDQYSYNPTKSGIDVFVSKFGDCFPQLSRFVFHHLNDMIGMTMFLGDDAEFVVLIRVYGDNGEPLILWASGNDFIDALYNLEKRCHIENFKVDRKYMQRSIDPTPKK